MKTFVIFGKKAIRKIIFLTAFIFIGMNAFSKNYFFERQKNDSNKITVCELNAYPNPSNGKINLEIDLQSPDPATLTVTNIIGQTMLEKKIMNPEKINFTIDLSNRPKGIYLLNLQQGEQSISKKIIVE